MKRVFFLIVIILMFVPAHAEDVTSTAGTVFFLPSTSTAKPELINDWWRGGKVRLMSLGNIVGAISDASAVFDLYEAGIASAIFKREKRNVINMFGGKYLNDEYLFNPYCVGLDFIKIWFSDEDFFSFSPSYNRAAYGSVNNYFFSFEAEYARNISEGFSAGVRIKYSNLIYITNYNAVTGSNIKGNDFEWAVDACWEGQSYTVLSQAFGLINAVSVGNMHEFFKYGWPIQGYDRLLDDGASINLYSKNLVLPEEYEKNTQGMGAKYLFYLSDLNNKSRMLMNINVIYDWRYHERSIYGSSDPGNYQLDGAAVYLDMLLKARIVLLDCFSVAAIKNLFFKVAFGIDKVDDSFLTSVHIDQPLEVEIAYFNNFIKIPIRLYSDNYYRNWSGNSIGCELTVFDGIAIRFGLDFTRSYSFAVTGLNLGFGLNLDDFYLDSSLEGRELTMLADLKWVF